MKLPFKILLGGLIVFGIAASFQTINRLRDVPGVRYAVPPASGDALVWNGTVWTNGLPSVGSTNSVVYANSTSVSRPNLATGSNVVVSVTSATNINFAVTNVGNSSIAAAANIAATKLSDGSVTDAEFQRLDATSSIQTQLNAKAASSHTHPATDITGGALAVASVVSSNTIDTPTLTLDAGSASFSGTSFFKQNGVTRARIGTGLDGTSGNFNVERYNASGVFQDIPFTVATSDGRMILNFAVATSDNAYDATAWNGSLRLATENSIRDKIESLVLGGGSATNAYNSIQEESTPLTARTNLAFIGSGFTASDDSGNNRTILTLAATLNTLSTLDGGALTNMNATRLDSGSVPIARIANGTLTAAKQADGDHGDFTYASGVATIDAGAITDGKVTSITTRSKLPSAIAYEDEANTLTDRQTFNGDIVLGNAATGLTIDWGATGKIITPLSTSAAFTIAFTGSATLGSFREFIVTNTATSDIVVTIPSCFSISDAADITSMNLLASSRAHYRFLRVTGGYHLMRAEKDNPFLSAMATYSGSSTNGVMVKIGTTNFVILAHPGSDGLAVVSTNTPSNGWTLTAIAVAPSDTAFASSWNGVTTIPPSKNAVYDALHLFDTDDDGKVDVLDLASAGFPTVNSSGVVTASRAVTGTANEISVTNGDGQSGAPTISLPASIDISGKTSFALIHGTAPTVDANGKIAIDSNSDNSTFTNPVVNFFSAGAVHSLFPIEGTPTDGQVAKYVAANKRAEWGTTSGAGTVTATGGALTANSVVLGAGTTDTKVVAGITTDGTSKLTLGVAGTSVGSVDFKNATSGTITLAPVAGALGTVAINLPAAAGTVAVSATAPITLSAAGAVGVTMAGSGSVQGTSGATSTNQIEINPTISKAALYTTITNAASSVTNYTVTFTAEPFQLINTANTNANVSFSGIAVGQSVTLLVNAITSTIPCVVKWPSLVVTNGNMVLTVTNGTGRFYNLMALGGTDATNVFVTAGDYYKR